MFKSLGAIFIAIGSIISGCPFKDQHCDGCSKERYRIKRVGRLPRDFKESSGLAVQDGLYVTIGDSGSGTELLTFRLKDSSPENFKLQKMDGVSNKDWEDLTVDDLGNLYIGDFGNNSNTRKDLNIIKYNYASDSVSIITFRFEDQKEYPPQRKKERNYDVEAFFWYNSNLYLFSKNKKWPYTKIYVLPDAPGDYSLTPYDSLRLKSPITSVDLDLENSNEAALLAYGKIMLFKTTTEPTGELKFEPYQCRKFRRSGQAEAILYLKNQQLMITNEKGKVFLMTAKPGT